MAVKDDSAMSITKDTLPYKEQEEAWWPEEGRHILAHYNDTSIVVYQILNDQEVKHWIKDGHFKQDEYMCGQSARIVLNFSLMVYNFRWTLVSGKERVIAITIERKHFDEILSNVEEPVAEENADAVDTSKIKLCWVADRLPNGDPVLSQRLVVQLLLGPQMVQKLKSWIQKIEDITDHVKEQEYCKLIQDDYLDKILTPIERTYIPRSASICETIMLEGFTKKNSNRNKTEMADPRNVLGGFCLADFFTNESALDEYEGYSPIGEVDVDLLFQQRLLGLDSHEPRDMILCFMGAFSPIHTRHIEVLEKSKLWIEENTHFRVISGYLATASDAYVKKKCLNKHQKGMSIKHRIKMAEIATADIEWLHVYKGKAVKSAEECGNKITKKKKLSVEIAEVCGADRITNKSKPFFWKHRSKHFTFCIGRKGETERVKRAFALDFKRGEAFNDQFFLVPTELENVSSTQIRNAMSQAFDATDLNDREEAINNIVEKGWITENVAKYILDNFHKLFMK